MNTWLKQLLALLLVLSVFLSGCATTRGPATCAGGDDHTTLSAADGAAGHGLQPVRHRHGATWIAVGFLIALVVTIDLLILPFTHEDPFPCCRGVLHVCH